MKVLTITFTYGGGAGIAAYRFHKQLSNMGVEAKMLCINHEDPDNNIFKYQQYHDFSWKRRVQNKLIPLFHDKKPFVRLRSALQSDLNKFEVFSVPDSFHLLENHPLVKEADIIHLHWIGQWFDYASFFWYIKKPIVWTFHDMNPFLGGFHYSDDMARNPHLELLDQAIVNFKVRLFQKLASLVVITPSKWLKEISGKTEAFKRHKHFHIFNGIDFDVFKYYDSTLIRKDLGIGGDQVVLSFVSENVLNGRKGFDLLLKALEMVREEYPLLQILAIGGISEESGISGNGIKYLGKIEEEQKLAEILSCSDFFILPSLEDNLPNVMVEALACGTPVLGFPVGGIKEVVVDYENGLLTKEIGAESLAEAIELAIQNRTKFDRQKIRGNALKYFDIKEQAKRYKEVYDSLLNRL